MFKKSYLTSILLIMMLILAACGTSDQGNSTKTKNESEQNTTEHAENDGQETEDEEDGLEEDEDSTDGNEEGIEEEDDHNVDESKDEHDNDEQSESNAEKVNSDEQDFAIEVLPTYTLTSEEPGKDSLFLTEDGNIFMRIETAPIDQESYDYFAENTVSLLESIQADGEEVANAATLPQGVNDAIGYTVKTTDSTVTGFVFEKDDLIVRLTIFDTLEDTHFNDFLQMGETITNK